MEGRLLIAGNWKMNLITETANRLVSDLVKNQGDGDDVDIVVCPPTTLLASVSVMLKDTGIILGAQNCYHEDHGAFTGEISAPMLHDLNCGYVILGHSERRSLFGESNEDIRKKMEAANAIGLRTIICVGESIGERKDGRAKRVVEEQIRESVGTTMNHDNCIIAYEPLWAIGTGETAALGDIGDMHAHIRSVLVDQGADGNKIRIIYGGSVKADNAEEIISVAEVSGALVGGASLISKDFLSIISAARRRLSA